MNIGHLEDELADGNPSTSLNSPFYADELCHWRARTRAYPPRLSSGTPCARALQISQARPDWEHLSIRKSKQYKGFNC